MYCPNCGQEYQDDATVCTGCGATLAAAPALETDEPVDPDGPDLETVLETVDAGLLAVARSLLEAEGIPCFAAGEGARTNLSIGSIRLQVPPERAAEARALIETLVEAPAVVLDEATDEESPPV
jgi:hypothetical protein